MAAKLRFCLGLSVVGLILLAFGLPAESRSSPVRSAATLGAEDSASWVAKRRKGKKKKKRKKKKKKKKKKKGGSDPLFDSKAPKGAPPKPPDGGDAEAPPMMLDLSGGAPAEGKAEGATEGAPVLDLSGMADEGGGAEALLRGEQPAGGSGSPAGKKGSGFDFGGGIDLNLGDEGLDFGGELEEFDLGEGFQLESEERQRFDAAIAMMSDEDYEAASQEFRFFLEDPAYEEFRQESEYQLAKALYKLGFYDPALKKFEAILDQGPSHRRYRKSIEWLFFISRKMVDQTPVLAILAQFRNVKFPKAYKDEFHYLLSKYLFEQARRLEIERIRDSEMEESKRQKVEEINWDEMAAGGFSDGGSFDFEAVGGGDSFDFGGGDAGGGGGFDFGGGGSGSGSGGGDEGGGGGFDFGGGGGGGGGGGADRGDEGGGFDFGGGGGGGGGDEGGFDFGSGGGGAPSKPKAPKEAAPVREAAPKTEQEAVLQGLDLIGEVELEGRFGPRAKYLEGLLHYLGGDAQNAVNAFLKVVRELNPREGSRLDPQLREMAFLSLARIHYGHNQFDRSAYYYDMIDRDSPSWLTALFEASWAYFQRGDYEKALGNLLTLHSPFFEKEYFPESTIVKAIIYFEACRYDETREIVDDFLDRFTKVMKEIERIAESKESSEALYARIRTLQSLSTEEEDEVTTRVLNLALADQEIGTAQDVVSQVEEQLAMHRELEEDFRNSLVGRELLDELEQAKIDRSRDAGETTRRKFEEELLALKALLAQALRIKLEVTRAERTILRAQAEARAAGQKAVTGHEIIPAVARTVVDDDRLYWPYEGEYWRDELGTSELDFSMCRGGY